MSTSKIFIEPKDERERLILDLDLSMIKLKMMDTEDGLNWSYEKCELAEYEYKRFLLLIKRYPKTGIVPDKLMDKFWHFHILDTRKYYNDCNLIFGEIVHHFPYLGMRGDEDKKNLIDSFNKTKELYSENFGEEMGTNYSHCDSGGGNCVSNCNAGGTK